VRDTPISRDHPIQLKHYVWSLAVAWTVVVAGLLAWSLSTAHQVTRDLAINEARSHFKRDQAFRFWATTHGGFYVPTNDRTPPNPYLTNIPERDIETPSDRNLTLMNPAYALRQMNEDFADLYGIFGHITSLNPLRPDNAPDNWERAALEAFEEEETEVLKFTEIKGEPYLRLIQPMITQEGCLKCHGHQGYQVGDVRGGVSVSVPMASYLTKERQTLFTNILSLSLLWVLGLAAISLGSRGLNQHIQERDRAQEALQTAHDTLELRIRQRTAKLSQANEQLQREITERKRAEEQVKKNLKEKEALLKEINHRVKNNMSVVSSLLNLQANRIQDKQARDALHESRDRIKTMALIHDKLYKSESLADIDFAIYIEDLCNYLFKSYNVTPEIIKLKLNIKDVKLEVVQGIPCALIINELISNALEHAFPDGRSGEIGVDMKMEDNLCILIVWDNGIGIPEAFDVEKSDSMGLQLIQIFIKQIAGSLQIIREKGTKFAIRFTVE